MCRSSTMKTRVSRALLVLLLGAGLIACSPEARTRGGGPGADPGNRDANIELHKGANPYFETEDEKDTIPVQGADQ